MLETTGERYMPDPADAHYEHPHRYLMARHFAEGRVVADLASGEGYGASWLAGSASYVIGIDVAEDAVRHARSRYSMRRPNLSFASGALEELPLSDSSIDLVTCFEAIEHVHEPKRIVEEISRVVGHAGIAIISTPNKHLHTDVLGIANPFHFSEMYLDEFEELLRSGFETVVILGQRTIAASWAWPLTRGDKEMSEFLIAPELRRLPETDAALEPMYALAYCTNGLADLRGELATTSLLVDRDLTLLGYYERAEGAIERLTKSIDELKVTVESVDRARRELAASVSRADHRAAEAETALEALRGSKAVRYTNPLRNGYAKLRASRLTALLRRQQRGTSPS